MVFQPDIGSYCDLQAIALRKLHLEALLAFVPPKPHFSDGLRMEFVQKVTVMSGEPHANITVCRGD